MASRVLENADNQITCKYNGVTHKGIDLVKYNHQTCNIIAHTNGKVVMIQTGQKNDKSAKGTKSYGNFVKMKHPNGYYTLYAHMKNVKVKKGQELKQGQVIGYMGNTGKSYGAHLHFEVRDTKEKRINPTPYINADLPDTKQIYQVYDNVKRKFLPKVKVGSKDYAGNFGHGVGAVKTNVGEEYKVYDMVKKRWLPPVKGLSDYAGNLGNNVGAIAIKSNNIKYRVHLRDSKRWLDWVTGYNVDDFKNGFAGNLNEVIDALQIANK